MTSVSIGKLGENIAREYLRDKGYNIIEQNYRTKYAEIDLITKKKNVLVFVEVRTKTGDEFGTPEDTINRDKKRKLRMNAMAYVNRKKWKGPYRIDAICIVLEPNETMSRLTHYQNIVQ